MVHRRSSTRESGVSTTGVALGLVVAVLAVIVAAEGYAATASVLTPGGSWVPGEAVRDGTPCLGERCDDIPFVPDGRVSFGQDVRNTERPPITILGFPGKDAMFVTIDSVEVGRDPVEYTTDPASTVAFDTVTLQPGEQRYFVFRGRFVSCADVGDAGEQTSKILDAVPLRVRMLLLEHTRDMRLLRPLAFHGPADGVC